MVFPGSLKRNITNIFVMDKVNSNTRFSIFIGSKLANEKMEFWAGDFGVGIFASVPDRLPTPDDKNILASS
jgi:hypothetical protein